MIGLGLSMENLTERHKSIIAQADLLVGGKRHLQHFLDQGVSCETVPITKDIPLVIDAIKNRMGDAKIVVLASGDPLFSGIGGTLISALGPDAVTIHPNISSVSAAFAEIKTSWHDAVLISLHGKETSNLVTVIEYNKKIAILTDQKRSPAWIANLMVQEEISDCQMVVLENLGTPDQRIRYFEDLPLVSRISFNSPNIVIVLNRAPKSPSLRNASEKPYPPPPSPIYPGMPEECFYHQNGLITKAEVRAVTLSKLQLTQDHHIFWDLGAGSGSVSIEVSRFISFGQIYAVEKNRHRIPDIQKNMEKFHVSNMTVVEANLPEGINDLPDPDRIFIGGGGVNIADIIRVAGKRMVPGGIMVVNTVLIQSMMLALDTLQQLNFKTDLIQMQVSKAKKMPFGERLEAQSPIWIISGKKGNKG